jgi:regulator of replication initiation timing
MVKDSNIVQLIKKKIIHYLTEIVELKNKLELVQSDKLKLENKVEKLSEELDILTQENKDLKEIVYEATKENTHFRSQLDKIKNSAANQPSSSGENQESEKIILSKKEMEKLETQFYNFDADENNVDDES